MEISANTNIYDLLKEYPFGEYFLVTLSPKFKGLKNPIMRKTIDKVGTLGKAAIQQKQQILYALLDHLASR
jgi:hypothetical protein